MVETDRLRSALLTSISHDLKTPLAAVLGAAGTLRDLSAQARRRRQKADLLATIIDEVRAAQPLHRQPARHDQARVGRRRAERRACTMSARSSAARCSAPARSWRSTRSRWSSPPTCRWSTLDAVLFEQVLFNLLDNAAKYAPAGTTIRIQSWRDGDSRLPAGAGRGRRHSAGRPGAHLRQVLPRAERRPGARRHRARASRSRAASSRPCSGTITAANRTDRSGAVFTITLPVPADSRAAGHRRMSAAPLKVLVVDDEPPIRKLLRMGLTTQGYEVLEAPNGKTGARAAGPEARPRHPRSRPARHRGARAAAADPRSATRACRSWCCRAAATRPARSRRSISAPTTT